MKKQIAILLPKRPEQPIGGYKIAYQYADFFSEIGYEVHFFYPHVSYSFFLRSGCSLYKKLKTFFGFFYKRIRNEIKVKNWYAFKNQTYDDCVFMLSPIFCSSLRKADVIFATSIETAYALKKFTAISNRKKYYLIQDFENWGKSSDEHCYTSYTFPFTKIVISKWLQKRVEETGNTATLIPNGLDFDYFKLSVPIENRKPTEVAMLYHLDDRKRCCDSMAALEIVKKQIPELHVTMFGTPEKPADLPDWYSYYRTPDQKTHNAVYNNAAIFVAASMKEGWGLTPCEAMQCGAAVACTNADGFLEFAIDNETALVSKVYDVQALAENIIKLVTDNDLRIKIAKAGNKFIQQFTWDKSFAKMKELIESNGS